MDEQNVKTENEENVQQPNVSNEAPQQEESVKETPQTETQQPKTQEEADAANKSQTPQNNSVQDNEVADYYADYIGRTQPTGLPELQFEEDGTLPADALKQWGDSVIANARQEAARQYAEMREEDRQWQKVYKEYPEVETNKKLRDLIHKQRIGNVLGGGKNDVLAAAKEILSLRDEGKRVGIQSAQETITRQKSADLETASTSSDISSKSTRRQELLEKSRSRNRLEADAARTELLKDMIESGEL